MGIPIVKEETVVECEGCGKVCLNDHTCSIFIVPKSKWRIGRCPMATHVIKPVSQSIKPLNPLKASKRGVKSK